jgi:uncharacterized protein with HEPN domain
MDRDDGYLDDIVAAAKQVAVYIEGLDRAAFLADRRTQDAVVRQIEIMGEASTRLSPELKAAHSEIDWKALAQLRNFYIHVYRRVNYANVWQTCRSTIPRIQAVIEQILPPQEAAE